jgi:hypothetical protein
VFFSFRCSVVPNIAIHLFVLLLFCNTGHVVRMGEVKGAYNILVGKPEGRRPLGRPRRRWEDNKDGS